LILSITDTKHYFRHWFQKELIMEFSNEKDIGTARTLLLVITDFLDKHQIPYCLEAGTLLGILRDGDIIPWDHDIDISIDCSHAPALNKVRWKLLFKGYKVMSRRNKVDDGPLDKNGIRIFKVKPLWKSIFKLIIPSLKEKRVILDIFTRTDHENDTYFISNTKTCKVDKKFFSSFDSVDFRGRKLKIPVFAEEYLTQRYGDWRVPVKVWDGAIDDLSNTN